ncbi:MULTISPECIES: diguanylate cyclase [unclassified Thiocapsa]|uniref:diguanylate cyclase n=1 Tax=unclassified Thiocapsa TaxID=2641286 RepID=UPI0035ADE049
MTAVASETPASRSPAAVTLGPRGWFVLLLLLTTVLIVTLSVATFLSFRTQIQRDVNDNLTLIAEQKRQQVEHWLARHRIDAESYFSGHAQIPMLLSQYLEGGREDGTLLSRMRARMGEVSRTLGLSGMAMLDTEGRLLMSIGDVDTRDQADLLQEAARQPRTQFVDLYRTAAGEVELGEMAPISARGEPPLGLIYLTWRAEQALFPLVASWPVPTRTAETYLVRRDDHQIRILTPLRHHPDAALSLTQSLTAAQLPGVWAAQGQRGILDDARDFRDIPVLAYATAIAGAPWLMIAKIDQDDAYAGIRTMAWATGLVAGMVLLLLYGAGYLLWRQAAARLAGERRLATLIEQGLTGYAEADLQGHLTRVNDRYCQIVGQPRETLLGRHLRDFTPPEDWVLNQALFDRLLRGEAASGIIEKRYQRQDGGLTHAQVAVALARGASGEPAGYLALVADFTERVRAETALKQQTELLLNAYAEQKAIYDAATVGVALAQNRVIQRCNRTMEQLFGYGPGELIGQCASLLYADIATFTAFGGRFTVGLKRQGYYQEEIEMVRKDGRPVWVRVSTVPIDPLDLSKGLAGTFEDISAERAALGRLRELNANLERTVAERTGEVIAANQALRTANAELAQLATTDDLTGAWNRRHFQSLGAIEISKAQRYGEPLSLLMFDIDHFKAINDRYGHQAGDRVLVELTKLVQRQLRTSDLLSRWGGEEFTLMMPHSDAAGARALAEKLRVLVASWSFPEVGRVTVSCGVAQLRPQETFHTWLKRVDNALYAAKEAGRDQVMVDLDEAVTDPEPPVFGVDVGSART